MSEIKVGLCLLDDPEYPAADRLIQRMRDKHKATLYIEKGEKRFTLVTTTDFAAQGQEWASGCVKRVADGDYSDFFMLEPGVASAVYGGKMVPTELLDPQIPPLRDH
ncbi:hypothetical protein LJC60_05510 [Ruminococcaceae bacterium OttesenSCG-928-D13]|nr:hypothetical protein [Ruminococcaceae bacterium OttesenSCG-928-D13]